MTHITNREDSYIAHLAGQRYGGKSPIGYKEISLAANAQNQPVGNAIASTLGGSIEALAVTTFGTLLYNLGSIIVSGADICTSCSENAYLISEKATNAFLRITPYFSKNFPNLPEIVKSGVSSCVGKIFSSETYDNCRTYDKANRYCYAINLAGGFINTVTENATTIGAIALGLTALYAYSNMKSYEADEHQAGEDVKQELSIKFLQIASRIKKLEDNEKTRGIAERILERQDKILDEIKSLEIPNMTWREREYIILPLLLAAKEKLAATESQASEQQKG